MQTTLVFPYSFAKPPFSIQPGMDAAAAAKSLQSCPTLCDPKDRSPPGSPVPGILQARTLEWVAISCSNAWKWKVKGKSLSHVWLLATPWTAARQEYWSGPGMDRFILFNISWQGKNVADITTFSHSISTYWVRFSSVAQWCLTFCNPGARQHSRLPCPSPTPGVCSDSCPSSRWCYPTISSSILPFSSCLQSFPASGSFPMSQFFTSGGHSTGVSASASVLSMNIKDWFPLGFDLAVQGTLKSLLQHHSSKASILQHSAFFIVQLSYPYMTTGKTIPLTRWTFVGKAMSLLFNVLSRLVIACLPRSKHLLISWL